MSLKAFNSLSNVLTIKQLTVSYGKYFSSLFVLIVSHCMLSVSKYCHFKKYISILYVSRNSHDVICGARRFVCHTMIICSHNVIINFFSGSFWHTLFGIKSQFIIRKKEPLVLAHWASYEKKTLA